MSTSPYAISIVEPVTITDSGSFTRASTATYFSKDGLMKTAAINELRIDHDPITGESKGLLIEEQRTNLLTYSSDASNAAWLSKDNISVASNTVISPDGTLSADSLVENTANGEHGLLLPVLSYVAGTAYTTSVYLKRSGRSIVRLLLPAAAYGENKIVWFDAASGLVTSTSGTGITTSAVAVGNGWYRIAVTVTASANATDLGAQIRLVNTGTNTNYTGDGYSGLYIWGAQLEAGAFPTSYIPTVASQVTRSADLISGNGLIWTNVPETDHAAWSSSATYALGDRVILTSTHKIYESLQAGNTNKNPVTELTWWIEVSPTNRWKAFDTSNSTQTVYPGNSPPNITYAFELGEAVGCVAFLNLSGADEITVTMDDPDYGIVYDETFDLSPLPQSAGWWHWFFGNRIFTPSLIVNDLPSFPNATIYVSISGNTDLAVGVILLGQPNQFSLGMKYGARIGIQDYSRKEVNDFGDTILVQRAFAKRATYDIFLDNDEVDQLQSYLVSIRATPVLWIGSNSFEATTIFGFYKNFDILLSYADHAECSLEIEGLT